MKKIIAVLLILACFGTAVFATPISSGKVTDLVLAGYEGNALASNQFKDTASVDKTVPASFTANENDDLFAAVQATQLTDTEAVQVEGEGIIFGILIGLGLAACGAGIGIGAVVLGLNLLLPLP